MTFDPKDFRRGTFQGGAPDTVRDAGFYARKRAYEKQVGRQVTLEEFRTVGGGMGSHPAVPGRGTSGLAPSSAYSPEARKPAGDPAGLTVGEISWMEGATSSGTSIFDPVLTELCYRWFSPEGGVVLDPFAGGSVRGIVASHLGREYHGVELRPEQVAANAAQRAIAGRIAPTWYEGDSRAIQTLCAHVRADMVFSCPPYADLEVYSDDPRDLSTLDYPAFVAAYTEIIAATCAMLKPDRFACFVVGEVRDKRGNYRHFVGDTVAAFRAAGLHYYNEAILITAVGSLPIRAGRQFASGRKLGKTHQNVLVFVKGDGKRAAQACSAAVEEAA
jgi:hypothetical protein